MQMETDDIAETVQKIHKQVNFMPRIQWKSPYIQFSKEKQLEIDVKTTKVNDFRIKDIQYELTYLKSEYKVDAKTNEKSIWYIISIKNLLPKSQRTEYELYFENVNGARVGKIRSSNSRIEFTLGLGKPTEYIVYFGFIQREYKIQLSNTVKFRSDDANQ